MTQRRRDHQLDRYSFRLGKAADIVPEIRQHLAEQRHFARFGHRSGGDGGRQIGTHSDPTLRIMMAIADVNEREDYIDDAIATLKVAIDMLEQYCRSALGYRTPADERPDDERTKFEQDGEPICHVSNCDQPVSSFPRTDNTLGYRMTGDYGGMCDAHRARARREAMA